MKYTTEIIDIDLLEADPNQPRKKFDKEAIENLAKTMESQDIINPIEIDTNNIIVTGEMRWRAAKVVGLKQITVKRLTHITEAEIFERQVIENLHHNALTSKEKQVAVLKLWNSGKYKDRTELAKRLGLSYKWVKHFIRLPEIEREIGKTEALQLGITKTFEIDDKISSNVDKKRVAKKAVEEDLTRDQIREVAKIIKTVPKDVKEEILKPKSEITLEEAKDIAEFPRPEQRKQVMEQIKRTKRVAKKIINEQKEIATGKKPMPVIAIINIDQKIVNRMQDIFFQVTQEYRANNIREYNGLTQEKCIEIMRKAYQFIFKEVEKYGREIMG